MTNRPDDSFWSRQAGEEWNAQHPLDFTLEGTPVDPSSSGPQRGRQAPVRDASQQSFPAQGSGATGPQSASFSPVEDRQSSSYRQAPAPHQQPLNPYQPYQLRPYQPYRPQPRRAGVQVFLGSCSGTVLLLLILVSALVWHIERGARPAPTRASSSSFVLSHTVIVSVTTNVGTDISYNASKGTGGSVTISGPWSHPMVVPGDQVIFVTAIPKAPVNPKASVTCRITIDGVQRDHQTSTGRNAIASCSATTG